MQKRQRGGHGWVVVVQITSRSDCGVRRAASKRTPSGRPSGPRGRASPRRRLVRRQQLINCTALTGPCKLHRVDWTALLAPHSLRDVHCAAQLAPREYKNLLFRANSDFYSGQASSKINRNAIGNHGARSLRALGRNCVLQCCKGCVGFLKFSRPQMCCVSIGVALTI